MIEVLTVEQYVDEQIKGSIYLSCEEGRARSEMKSFLDTWKSHDLESLNVAHTGSLSHIQNPQDESSFRESVFIARILALKVKCFQALMGDGKIMVDVPDMPKTVFVEMADLT